MESAIENPKNCAWTQRTRRGRNPPIQVALFLRHVGNVIASGFQQVLYALVESMISGKPYYGSESATGRLAPLLTAPDRWLDRPPL